MLRLTMVRRKVFIVQLSLLALFQLNFSFAALASPQMDALPPQVSEIQEALMLFPQESEFSPKPILELAKEAPLLAAVPGVWSGGKEAVPLRGMSVDSQLLEDPRLVKIDALTWQILLKEIALQRFNLRYTLEVAKQGRWKGWRYAALQEANTGMGLAGAIISTSYRGARLRNAGAVKPCIQESANYIPMIGSIIGAGAASIEFGINYYHDFVASRKGFSPKAAIAYVGGLKKEIESLLNEREAAVSAAAQSPELAGHVAVDQVEGRVLRDVNDLTLQEFERFHVGARRLLAFQQCQYFYDFAKFTTNAIGYEFAYLSLHRHHRVWNGRAGALFAVSGALTMFAPILSRGFGKAVGEVNRYRLKSLIADSSSYKPSTLEADLVTLDKLCHVDAPDRSQKSAERLGLYGSHLTTFDQELRTQVKKNAAAKLTATQNIGAGVYVGGTKLASGILFMVPGFNHHYNTSGKRSNHVTNDYLFTASVIAIPSSAFAMIDTLRIQVKGELSRRQQIKSGTLPKQVLAKRLKELDDMEARLAH